MVMPAASSKRRFMALCGVILALALICIGDVKAQARFSFVPQASTLVLEGELSEFEVVFDGPPPVDVAIRVDGQEDTTTVTSPELIITGANWNTSSHRFFAGATQNDFIQPSPFIVPLSVQVITPNTTANMTLDLTALDTNRPDVLREIDTSRPYPADSLLEGTFVIFQMALASIPKTRVVVELTSRNSIVEVKPSRLIFDSVTWNLPQRVRVLMPDNHEYGHTASIKDHVTFHVRSNDTDFDSAPQDDLVVNVADDEQGQPISFASLRWHSVPFPHGFVVRFEVDVAAPEHDVRTPRVLHFGDGNAAMLPADPIFLTDAFNQTIVRYTMHHTYARGADRTQHAALNLCCISKVATSGADASLRLRSIVQLDPSVNTSSPFVPAATVWHYHGPALNITSASTATGAAADATSTQHPSFLHPVAWAAAPVRFFLSDKALGDSVNGVPSWVSIDPYLGAVAVDRKQAYPGVFAVPVRVENVFTGATTAYMFMLHVPLASLVSQAGSVPPVVADAATSLLDTLPSYTSDASTTVAAALTEVGHSARVDAARDDSPIRCVTDIHALLTACTVEANPTPASSAVVKAMASAVANASALALAVGSRDLDAAGTVALETPGVVAPLAANASLVLAGVNVQTSKPLADASTAASANPPLYAVFWLTGHHDHGNETLGLQSELQEEEAAQLHGTLATPLVHATEVTQLSPTSVLVSVDRHAVVDSPVGSAQTAVELLLANVLPRLQYAHTGLYPQAGLRHVMGAFGSGEALTHLRVVSIDPMPTSVAPTLDLNAYDTGSASFDTVYYDQEYSTNISLAAGPAGLQLTQPRALISRAEVVIRPPMDAPAETLTTTLALPPPTQPPAVATTFPKLLFAAEVSSTQTIISTDRAAATDIAIVVHVLHTQVADLTITLHRHGRPYVLAQYVGGPNCDASHLLQTTFSPHSSVQLSGTYENAGTCAAGSQGVFRPLDDLSPLLDARIDGDWTLTITDAGVRGDGASSARGLLLAWSLLLFTDPSNPTQALHQPLYGFTTPVPQLGTPALPRPLPWNATSTGVLLARDTFTTDVQGRVRRLAVDVHLSFPPNAVGNDTVISLTLRHGNVSATLLHFNRQSALASYAAAVGRSVEEVLDQLIIPRCVPDGYFVFDDDAPGGLNESLVCEGENVPPVQLVTAPQALDAFSGTRVTGDWTLEVEATGGAAVVSGWGLRFSLAPNIDIAFNATTGTLSLEGVDSPDNYRALLDSVVYSNDAPTTEPEPIRNITFTVIDEHQEHATASALVAIHHLLSTDLVSVFEDDTTSEGRLNTVASMLAGTAPPNAANWEERAGYGIVITNVDNTNGQWQYSLDGGSIFANITSSVSLSFGLLLPGSNIELGVDSTLPVAAPWNTSVGATATRQGLVRFVPDKDFHGTAQMAFSMWNTDALRLPAGTYVNTQQHPVSLHNASAVATLKVLPVNDQPILSPGGELRSLREDDTANIGTRVADIVAGLYFDMDTLSPVADTLSDKMGLAVTGVDRRNGDWLWSCADEAVWYASWSATGDTNSSAGTGTTSSLNTTTSMMTTASPTTTISAEELAATFARFIGGVLPNNDTWPPNPTPAKATLLGPGCRIKFEPNKDFNTELSKAGEPWNDVESILPWVRAVPWDMTDNHTSGTFSVDTRSGLRDVTSSFGRVAQKMTVNVSSINDAPLLRMGGPLGTLSTTFLEGHAPTAITGPAFTLSDRDNASLSSLSITVAGVRDGALRHEHIVFAVNRSSTTLGGNYTVMLGAPINGTLLHAVDRAAAFIPRVTRVVDDSTGATIAVSYNASTARNNNSSSHNTTAETSSLSVELKCASAAMGTKCPLAMFRGVLREAHYVNTRAEPTNGTRVLTVVVGDGVDETTQEGTVFVAHTLENAPVLRLPVNETTFVEQAGPVPVLSSLVLRDEDHNEYYYMAEAHVGFADWEMGHDTLSIANLTTAAGSSRITATFNSTAGALRLRGRAPLSAYEAVLQAVVFDNDEDEPLAYTRRVAAQVVDTAGLTSNVAAVTISVQLVNEHAPVITAGVPLYAVTEDVDHGIALGGDVQLLDADVPASTSDRYRPVSQHFISHVRCTMEPVLEASPHVSHEAAFLHGRLVVEPGLAAGINASNAADNDEGIVLQETLTNGIEASNRTVVGVPVPSAYGEETPVNFTVHTYANGSLLLEGPAPIEAYQRVLASLRYVTHVEEFASSGVNVTLEAHDGAQSAHAFTFIALLPVNDAPVAHGPIAAEPTPVFVEGSVNATRVFNSGLFFSDNDNATLPEATITLHAIDYSLALEEDAAHNTTGNADNLTTATAAMDGRIASTVEVLVVSGEEWAALLGADTNIDQRSSNINATSMTNGTNAHNTTATRATSSTHASITTTMPMTGTLEGNGTSVLTAYNLSPSELTSLLQLIGYRHLDANPGNPTPGPRAVSVEVSDGIVSVISNSTTGVIVQPVNDAPFFAVEADPIPPVPQFVEEAAEGVRMFSANRRVQDVDSQNASRVRVYLTDASQTREFVVLGNASTTWLRYLLEACPRLCANTQVGRLYEQHTELAGSGDGGPGFATAASTTTPTPTTTFASGSGSLSLGSGIMSTAFLKMNTTATLGTTQTPTTTITTTTATFVGDNGAHCLELCLPFKNSAMFSGEEAQAEDTLAWALPSTHPDTNSTTNTTARSSPGAWNVSLPVMQLPQLRKACDALCGFDIADRYADSTSDEMVRCFYQCQLYRELGKSIDLQGILSMENASDILRTVTYWNTHDEMNGRARHVSVEVADDRHAWSAPPLLLPVTLVPVNDPPRLFADKGYTTVRNVTYTERGNGVPVFSPHDDAILLEDDDDKLISEVVISLTNAPTSSREGLFLDAARLPSGFAVEYPSADTVNVSAPLSNTSNSNSMSNISSSRSSNTTALQDGLTLVVRRDDASILVLQSTSAFQSYPPLTDYEKLQAVRSELHPTVRDAIPLAHTMRLHVANASLYTTKALLQAILYTNVEHALMQPKTSRNILATVRDSFGAASNTVTTHAVLVSVNDAPLLDLTRLTPLKQETEDGPGVTFDILPAFVDAEQNPYFTAGQRMPGTVEIVQQPAFGDLSMEQNATVLRYVPAADDYGIRPFVVRACDTSNLCSENVTLTVAIEAVNDAPAQRSAYLTYNVTEDTRTEISLDLFYIDVEEYHLEPFRLDADGARNMTVSLRPESVQAQVQLVAENGIEAMSLNTSTRVLTLEPVQHYVGPVSVAFTVCDTEQLCTNMTLHINVTQVNDLPAVAGELRLRVVEDTEGVFPFTAFDVEDSACPPELIHYRFCKLLDLDLTDPPSNGSARLVLSNDTTLPIESRYSIVYTPDDNFFGQDTFVVSSCDSEGGCSVTTVVMTVAPVDDAIMLLLQELVVTEDVPVHINLFAHVRDVDNAVEPAGISIQEPPLFGTASYNKTTGMFLYTPLQDYFGSDNITLNMCNVVSACEAAVLNITVVGVNDPPVVLNATRVVWEDNVLEVDLLGLTSDVVNENAPVVADAIAITRPPVYGSVAYNTGTYGVEVSVASSGPTGLAADNPASKAGAGAGTAAYLPNADYFGGDTFAFEACDGFGSCRTGIVFITVQPVNDAPRLATGTPDPRAGTLLTPAVLPFSAEEDTYTLLPLYALHDDVDHVDDHTLPVPEDIAAHASDSNSVSRPDLLMTVLIQPQHGTVTMSPRFGMGIYEPTHDYVGPDRFSYRVCDACSFRRDAELGRIDPSRDPACVRQRTELGKDTADNDLGCLIVNVTVQVRNVNDPPNAAALATVAQPGQTATFDPLASTRDIDDVQYAHMAALISDSSDGSGLSISNATAGRLHGEFNLDSAHDINATSLRIVTQPTQSGTVEVVVSVDSGTTPTILYRPSTNTTVYGANSFEYAVCDRQGECDKATVTVHTASPTPTLVSVEALGACVDAAIVRAGTPPSAFIPLDGLSCEPDAVYTDASYGANDRLLLRFDLATNMPPYGTAGQELTEQDVYEVFSFSQALTGQETPGRISGEWHDPTLFVLRVEDAGVLAPLLSQDTLQVSVRGEADRPCGQFGTTLATPGVVTATLDEQKHLSDAALTPSPITSEDGLLVVSDEGYATSERDAYCVLAADELSYHAASRVQGFDGHFGLTLPRVVGVEVTNPPQVELTYLGQDTVLSIALQPALPLATLYKLCTRAPSEVFDFNVLAEGMEATLDCSLLLPDGDTVSTAMTQQEYACIFEFEALSQAEQNTCQQTGRRSRRSQSQAEADVSRGAKGNADGVASSMSASAVAGVRARRETDLATLTSNRLLLHLTSVTGVKSKPGDADFVATINSMLNRATLHEVVLGNPFDVSGPGVESYEMTRSESLEVLFGELGFGLRYVGNNVETPKLVSVQAMQPSKTYLDATGDDITGQLQPGCKLVLGFDRDTNTPTSDGEVDLYPYLSDKEKTRIYDNEESTVSALSREDLDRIFTFEPSLASTAVATTASGNSTAGAVTPAPADGTGTFADAYAGQWTSLSTLEITIFEPNTANKALRGAPQVLQIGFRPTTLEDPCREDPSPCEQETTNGYWGLCNQMGTSCRSHEVFNGQNITGTWGSALTTRGSGTGAATTSNNLFLLFLVVPVVGVGAAILFRRTQRRRDKRRMTQLVNQWRAMLGSDMVDNPVLKPSSTEWSRPPGMVAMRNNADPFLSAGEGSDPFAGRPSSGKSEATGAAFGGGGLHDPIVPNSDAADEAKGAETQRRIDEILRSPPAQQQQQTEQQQEGTGTSGMGSSLAAELGKSSRIVLPPLRQGVAGSNDANNQQGKSKAGAGAGPSAALRDLPPLKRAAVRGSQRRPGLPAALPVGLPGMATGAAAAQQEQEQQQGLPQRAGPSRLPPLRKAQPGGTGGNGVGNVMVRRPSMPGFPQGPPQPPRGLRPSRQASFDMGRDADMSKSGTALPAFKPRGTAVLPTIDRRLTDPFAGSSPGLPPSSQKPRAPARGGAGPESGADVGAAATAGATNTAGAPATSEAGDGSSKRRDPFRRPSVQRPQVPGSIGRTAQGGGARKQPPMRVPSLKSGAPPPMRMPEMLGPRRSLGGSGGGSGIPFKGMARPSLDAGKAKRMSTDIGGRSQLGGMKRPATEEEAPQSATKAPTQNQKQDAKPEAVRQAEKGEGERPSIQAGDAGATSGEYVEVEGAVEDESSTDVKGTEKK